MGTEGPSETGGARFRCQPGGYFSMTEARLSAPPLSEQRGRIELRSIRPRRACADMGTQGGDVRATSAAA